MAYTNYTLDRGGPNRFFQMADGSWIYESNYPVVTGNGTGNWTEVSNNANGLYYAVNTDGTKDGWHELLLPANGAPIAENPYLADASWQGMATLGRYAVPLEDVLILIDGKDFDGIDQSQLEAGIWLVAGLVPGSKVLKPVSKIAKGAYRNARYAVKEGSRTVIKNFDDLLELSSILSKLRPGARFIDSGTGIYSLVRGHHPLSKVAFSGDEFYNLNNAFSVSVSRLESYGDVGIHNVITGRQNSLYSAFAKTGDRLTLEKMAEIEIQAMVEAGIPQDVATGWVIRALEDLERQGVKYITNIPWNSTN